MKDSDACDALKSVVQLQSHDSSADPAEPNNNNQVDSYFLLRLICHELN